MENIIIIAIVICLFIGACYYIYKAKKKGAACIGCPHTKNCQSHKCSCSCGDDTKERLFRSNRFSIKK